MARRWSDDETNFLKTNVHIFDDAKMALEMTMTFNRKFSKDMVRKYSQRLSIKKVGYRGHFHVITQPSN